MSHAHFYWKCVHWKWNHSSYLIMEHTHTHTHTPVHTNSLSTNTNYQSHLNICTLPVTLSATWRGCSHVLIWPTLVNSPSPYPHSVVVACVIGYHIPVPNPPCTHLNSKSATQKPFTGCVSLTGIFISHLLPIPNLSSPIPVPLSSCRMETHLGRSFTYPFCQLSRGWLFSSVIVTETFPGLSYVFCQLLIKLPSTA